MNLPLGRQVLGPLPHSIEAFHADRIHNMLHELLPVAVLRGFAVQPKQARDEAGYEFLRLGTPVEPAANCFDGRHYLGVNGIHDHVRVPLQEAHDGGDLAGDLFSTGGCFCQGGKLLTNLRLVVGLISAGAFGGDERIFNAQACAHAITELRDLVQEVVTQPRRGGELHPVRLLVQAHPQTEIFGLNIELFFNRQNIRCHQHQTPARSTIPSERRIRLVLPEHAG